MITRNRKTREVKLACDDCLDKEVAEVFPPSTEIAAVAKWARDRGWHATHRGGWLWDHRCPRCVIAKATSPAYLRRIHA